MEAQAKFIPEGFSGGNLVGGKKGGEDLQTVLPCSGLKPGEFPPVDAACEVMVLVTG